MSDQELGIYKKYYVERLDDQKHKHDDCFYFVLDTVHDPFAVPALHAYAMACQKEYPKLSRELFDLIASADETPDAAQEED